LPELSNFGSPPAELGVYLIKLFKWQQSDTTLRFDRETKALAYARSGILEYWVLDVIGRKLHVYLMPSAEGYQSELILAEKPTIAPLAFPECAIVIQEMLPSAIAS
jgi:Uma2 family endonuclease